MRSSRLPDVLVLATADELAASTLSPTTNHGVLVNTHGDPNLTDRRRESSVGSIPTGSRPSPRPPRRRLPVLARTRGQHRGQHRGCFCDIPVTLDPHNHAGLCDTPSCQCARQESNLRPFAPEANALSPELRAPWPLPYPTRGSLWPTLLVPMADQAAIFLAQAELAEGRSPLYARLWRQFADDPRVAEIAGPSPTWDAPLRLNAGLHYLALTGRASWDRVDEALVDRREFLREWVETRGVQTNEVQRCWTLLPCFLEAVRRTGAIEVDLVELGPSAGLNLVWDRYGYTYGAGRWGPADAELHLAGQEARPVPPRRSSSFGPQVRSRTGIDLNPIDVSSDAGALTLKSFVWADQPERLRRLDAAIAAARADPPALVQGDVAAALTDVLDGLGESSGLILVWETAVLGYLPEERRARVYDAVARAGERRPVAFVQTQARLERSDGALRHDAPGPARRQAPGARVRHAITATGSTGSSRERRTHAPGTSPCPSSAPALPRSGSRSRVAGRGRRGARRSGFRPRAGSNGRAARLSRCRRCSASRSRRAPRLHRADARPPRAVRNGWSPAP